MDENGLLIPLPERVYLMSKDTSLPQLTDVVGGKAGFFICIQALALLSWPSHLPGSVRTVSEPRHREIRFF